MIDVRIEPPLRFAEAVELFPRRQGRKPHVSTIYRIATRGWHGIVLESIQVGSVALYFGRRRPTLGRAAPNSVK